MNAKQNKLIRIPMPLRYLINLALILALWGVFTGLMGAGVITNYWSGILIMVGVNIILAVSLNIATGYLGQLPLGHAGFMAVGAYAGGIFLKSTPVADLLKAGNEAACLPYVIGALVLSAVVAGIFGLIIGIPALRLRGDYLAIITLGFGEIIRVALTNIDSLLGFKFTFGAAGLKRIPKFSGFHLVFICVVLSCTLIHMIMNDDTWYVVRNTRGVTGFVGPGSKPVPLTDAEMESMGLKVDAPNVPFSIGDLVVVKSGVWEDTTGVVRQIDHQNRTVTINIDMFGRETPVEISFNDVETV